jgi:MFS family permease
MSEEPNHPSEHAALVAAADTKKSDSRSRRIVLVTNEEEEHTEKKSDGSSVITRQRTLSLADENAIDRQKELKEETAKFWEKYGPGVKVGIFSLLSAVSTLTQPFLPEIKKKYFGSDPKAAQMSSIILAASAVVGMFTASAYGKLSDSYGRRPFFILFALANLLTQASVAFFSDTILVSMVVGGVANLIQGSFMFAWLGDTYSSKMRMQMVAVISAVSSFSALLFITTIFVKFDLMKYICVGAAVLQVVFVYFFIDESLPPDSRTALTAADVLHNPFGAMLSLAKSKVALGLTTILFFYVISQLGTGDIYMYYLNQRIGFTAVDNAYIACAAGIVEPFFFLFVLPRALRVVSPMLLMTAILCCVILELLIIATLWAKWAAFALALPMVAFVNLMTPVALGLLQNTCSASSLGQRMAGVQAVIDLGSAIGPLFFGLLYAHVNNALIFLPFVVCAVLALPPIFVSLKVNKWIKEEQEAS